MRLLSFKIFPLVILLTNCAHNPVRMETCLPITGASMDSTLDSALLACTKSDKTQYMLDFRDAKDYVCHPMADWSAYVKACNRQ